MRLIDAEAVYKILESCEIRKATIASPPLTDWEFGYTCGIERAESEIECAPTVDAVPVRHGEWTRHVLGSTGYGTTVMHQCSECECMTISRFRYCPNCGAKMDAERKEE